MAGVVPRAWSKSRLAAVTVACACYVAGASLLYRTVDVRVASVDVNVASVVEMPDCFSLTESVAHHLEPNRT